MTAPLVTEERIHRIVQGVLEREGWPTDEDMSIEGHIKEAIRTAIRETAEACAKVCDDIWDKEAQEALDPKAEPRYHDAIECGAAIRARIVP